MMIKRHFLKSVTAVAFIFGIVQSCGIAKASVFHTPMAGWSVGPIPAQGAGGATYCSLKNTYVGGRTLVFARDNQGNNSIAVNFGRKLFRANHKYKVTMRSGHVARSMEALAAAPQILVMETGIDTVFYNAVGRNHDISFALRHGKYGFDLDESVYAGMVQLGNCVAALQNNVPFAARTVPLMHPAAKIAVRRHAHVKTAKKRSAAKRAKVFAAQLPVSPRDQMKAEIANQVLALTGPKNDASVAATAPAPHVSAAIPVGEPVPLKPVTSAATPAPVMTFPTPPAPEEKPAAATPAPPAAQAGPAVSEPAGAAMPPVATHAAAADNAYLKKLLRTAHIVAIADIKTSADKSTLHWTADGLFGSAQQLSMAPDTSMKMMADKYLQKTATLCAGAYAKKVDGLQQIGGLNVLKADVTCVDGKNNAAAAILFLSGRGKFSVITQEGTTDQLATAMDDRDSIVAALPGHAKN